MWPFKKKDHKRSDVVERYEFNNELYLTPEQADAARERYRIDVKRRRLNDILYFLGRNKYRFHDVVDSPVCAIDDYIIESVKISNRNYVFKGTECDIKKLADLLITNWEEISYLIGEIKDV